LERACLLPFSGRTFVSQLLKRYRPVPSRLSDKAHYVK
jgi:hypothetical protein